MTGKLNGRGDRDDDAGQFEMVAWMTELTKNTRERDLWKVMGTYHIWRVT